VIREVAAPFLGGLIFFSFVFLMFQMLRLAEFFIVHGVSIGSLTKLCFLLMLSFLPTALPIAFLVGVLVGFGRLSSDSELVAMKAHGLSLYRLAAPVAGFAVLVSALSLALNLEWVPNGEQALKKNMLQISNTKVIAAIKEGTFTSGFFDLLIFADKLDPKSNKLQRVFIYDERNSKNPMTIIAQEGELIPIKPSEKVGNQKNNTLSLLKLYRGSIHNNDISEKTYQKINFGEYRLYLKMPGGSGISTVKPKMMPYRKLIHAMESHARSSSTFREISGELWRRISVALSPLFFVILGIGYGTVRTRAVRAGAMLISFSVILVYWTLQVYMTSLVHNGTLPPELAMQIPNLILLLIAIPGFRNATW
jgi:lipopolysaccharide export system permease protein